MPLRHIAISMLFAAADLPRCHTDATLMLLFSSGDVAFASCHYFAVIITLLSLRRCLLCHDYAAADIAIEAMCDAAYAIMPLFFAILMLLSSAIFAARCRCQLSLLFADAFRRY